MARCAKNRDVGGLAGFIAETPARVEQVRKSIEADYLRTDANGHVSGISPQRMEYLVERYARLTVSGSQRLNRGYECGFLVEAAAVAGIMPRDVAALLLPDHAQALADLLARMPAATREGRSHG